MDKDLIDHVEVWVVATAAAVLMTRKETEESRWENAANPEAHAVKAARRLLAESYRQALNTAPLTREAGGR